MLPQNKRVAQRFVVWFLLVCVTPVLPGMAQVKVQKEAAEPDKAEPALTSQSFGGGGLDLSTEDVIIDRDATPECQQRVRELEAKAKQIYNAKQVVDDKRRPWAADRDLLVGQSRQADMFRTAARKAATEANQTIAQCNIKLRIASGNVATQLNNQKRNAQISLNNATATINQADGIINTNGPKINALDNQIKPLDDELLRLWNELEECRKQWVEIHQPIDKYARGDFESLRKVLDKWLVTDGLWAQALCWGGLCAYEMGEYVDAMVYLDKADEIRGTVYRERVQWSELAALYGLVGRKLKGQSVKANKSLQEAKKLIDKNRHFEAYFLLARCYSERPEDHLPAKANFENALKIRPNYVCAQLGLARIQATSNNEMVRDQKAGIATLERLWIKTGKRSWRVAYYLVEAYDASRRKDDADKFWQFVMSSDAPAEWKEKLAKERKKA